MRTYPIVEIIEHHVDMKSLLIETDLSIRPGQFVMLWLPGVDEKPFSASDWRDGLLELTVCAVGPCTRELMRCETGQYLGVRGPYGSGFTLADNQLLLGGGMGIAPLRYLAKTLRRSGCAFSAVFGAASARDIMFLAEYEEKSWCQLVTEDGSAGMKRLVTDGLEDLITDHSFRSIAACGPQGMLDEIQRILRPHRTDYQLAFERYMKCGIGLCGTCCVEGTGIRVCAEGPVLSRADLERWRSGMMEMSKSRKVLGQDRHLTPDA
jgi:dihydroorotate dehydrogenase electron transfer subunit